MNPQKFMFDRHFQVPSQDTVKPVAQKPVETAVEKPIEESVEKQEPTKTYEDGLIDGQEKAAAAFQVQLETQQQQTLTEKEVTFQNLEQAKLESLQKLQVALLALSEQQQTLQQEIEHKVIKATGSMVEKLFPVWYQSHGEGETLSIIKNILAQTEQENRLILRVHPDDLATTEATATDILDEFALQSELVVKADEALEVGDIKVRWAGGGAEYRPKLILEQINTFIETLIQPAKAEQEIL